MARKNLSLSKIGNKNRLGVPHTEETKDKIREKIVGRIVSDVTKRKMSMARSKYYSNKKLEEKNELPK